MFPQDGPLGPIVIDGVTSYNPPKALRGVMIRISGVMSPLTL